MITVTENAAAQIQKLLEKQAARRHAACASASRPAAARASSTCSSGKRRRATNDLIFDGPNGVRVWIDPRSHRLLDGTTLDYDTSLLSRGFVFQNPHAKSTCGCGTSFSM